MVNFQKLWGVDYGSKMAGTTVICYYQQGGIYFRQSVKNKSADQMLLEMLKEKSPTLVMIDAPLSLPRVYSQPGLTSPDYFYRQCDRDLKAMSPMFLGGLTARAMQLAHEADQLGITCLETYPAAQAREAGIDDYKKQPLQLTAQKIAGKYFLLLQEEIQNQHQLDALLAFIGGVRYLQNNYLVYGAEEEGLIYI